MKNKINKFNTRRTCSEGWLIETTVVMAIPKIVRNDGPKGISRPYFEEFSQQLLLGGRDGVHGGTGSAALRAQ